LQVPCQATHSHQKNGALRALLSSFPLTSFKTSCAILLPLAIFRLFACVIAQRAARSWSWSCIPPAPARGCCLSLCHMPYVIK
jgi:hypothetical protein